MNYQAQQNDGADADAETFGIESNPRCSGSLTTLQLSSRRRSEIRHSGNRVNQATPANHAPGGETYTSPAWTGQTAFAGRTALSRDSGTVSKARMITKAAAS